MNYLFLAIPNFSGSTLMHEVFATSKNVAVLTATNKHGPDWNLVEGMAVAKPGYDLMGPHSIEANMEHVYADPSKYDWEYIGNTWNENWSKGYPNATVRMQKSPSDIFRIDMINKHFGNVKWIIMVRNPYSFAESIIRKATYRMDPFFQLDQICFHVMRVMELQIENAKMLGENGYTMTYEDFCVRPEIHRENILKFMPELGDISVTSKMHIKGDKNVGIHDDSKEKLDAFFKKHPKIKNEINKYFIPCRHIIEAWGYEIL